MTTKNVLIVDDEPDVVKYLSEVLESKNINLFTADNAEDGFKNAQKVHPDLICLDIMMPGKSGFSLYKKLRRKTEFNEIPIIIISGVEQVNEFDFRKFVKDKKVPAPECYFEKPIDVTEFHKTVKSLLNLNNQHQIKGRGK